MKRLPIVATAVALTLAACGPSAPESASPSSATASATAPTPPATPTVTPTGAQAEAPTSSPSTTPTDTSGPADPGSPPPYESLVVHTGGVGPLAVGEPAAGNPGAAMIFLVEDYCYDEALGVTSGDLDRFLPNYPPGVGIEGESAELFSLDVAGGDIARIDVWDAGLQTEEGIHIGSTLGELMEVYPTTLESGEGYSPTSSVWWIEGADGTLVFETQAPGEWVDEPEPDVEDAVILMRVLAPGVDPDWAAANSGNTAGACPF